MTLTVITGPPAAGKTTYVREHAQPGDIVIDLDVIACALTIGATDEHDYPAHLIAPAKAARYAALKTAMPLSRVRDLWVIDSSPSPASLRWYREERARIVELRAENAVLAARMAARPQSAGFARPAR